MKRSHYIILGLQIALVVGTVLLMVTDPASSGPLLRGLGASGAPTVVSYQGQVVVDNAAYDGTGYFKFAVVNQAGDTAYWTNDGSKTDGSEPTAAVSLTVDNGLFEVLLGDTGQTALTASVFDGTDRMQHMLWRYLDEHHPARPADAPAAMRMAIEDTYVRMDDLVGRTMARCQGEDTLLMVVSDHGFTTFRRCVDLNGWLEENGYLVVNEDQRGKEHLAGVDTWEMSDVVAEELGLDERQVSVFSIGRPAVAHHDLAHPDCPRRPVGGELHHRRDADVGNVGVKGVSNRHNHVAIVLQRCLVFPAQVRENLNGERGRLSPYGRRYIRRVSKIKHPSENRRSI